MHSRADVRHSRRQTYLPDERTEFDAAPGPIWVIDVVGGANLRDALQSFTVHHMAEPWKFAAGMQDDVAQIALATIRSELDRAAPGLAAELERGAGAMTAGGQMPRIADLSEAPKSVRSRALLYLALRARGNYSRPAALAAIGCAKGSPNTIEVTASREASCPCCGATAVFGGEFHLTSATRSVNKYELKCSSCEHHEWAEAARGFGFRHAPQRSISCRCTACARQAQELRRVAEAVRRDADKTRLPADLPLAGSTIDADQIALRLVFGEKRRSKELREALTQNPESAEHLRKMFQLIISLKNERADIELEVDKLMAHARETGVVARRVRSPEEIHALVVAKVKAQPWYRVLCHLADGRRFYFNRSAHEVYIESDESCNDWERATLWSGDQRIQLSMGEITEDYLNPEVRRSHEACATVNPPRGLNLFRSQAEARFFDELTAKYPDHIVQSNKLLKQVVSLEAFPAIFSAEEFRYLTNCILDFVVYNREGVPVELFELQRGPHHAETLQMERDDLKRRACKLAGFELKEKF